MIKPVKLTDLLTEGNVWDRNEDGSLPTLADTMRRHAEKKAEVNEGTEHGKVKSSVVGDNARKASPEVRFKTGMYNSNQNERGVMLMALNKDHIYLTKKDAQKVVAILIEYIKGTGRMRDNDSEY